MRYQEMKKQLNSFTNLFDFMILNKYSKLMRLDKPVGYLLVVLPCFWTIAFSSRNPYELIKLITIFIVGAIIIRGAGCIINDIADREIDKKVERTKLRPLASGEVSIYQALMLLFVLFFIGLILLLFLTRESFYIAFFSLIPITIYPFCKRFTNYAQLFLGFTFNLGIFIAWFAIYGNHISYVPFLIYFAAVMWTLGYDTIYAFQDYQYDKENGFRAFTMLCADAPNKKIKIIYCISFLILMLTGLNTNMGILFYIIMMIAGYQLDWQTKKLDVQKPVICKQLFESNVLYGFIVLIAILSGK